MRAALAGLGVFLFSNSPAQQQSATYHDALVVLRDTLTGVQAALSDLRRDLPSAARETVLARTAEVHARCRGAAAEIPRAVRVLRPATRESRTRREGEALISSIRRLRVTIHRECERGLRRDGPGTWPDSLRAWIPYRASRIDRVIRAYEAEAGKFAAAAGFKLEPKLPKK
ncbi:MAG: hypothetical protein HY700_13780 [Gemmatimonadetes bacterium]|nr:hypothetical protein [Gemmatimonadota bacterium]